MISAAVSTKARQSGDAPIKEMKGTIVVNPDRMAFFFVLEVDEKNGYGLPL
jgi:hypothetical protein